PHAPEAHIGVSCGAHIRDSAGASAGRRRVEASGAAERVGESRRIGAATEPLFKPHAVRDNTHDFRITCTGPRRRNHAFAKYPRGFYPVKHVRLRDNMPAETPKLLDRVREACRLRHLSYRTEQAYVRWIVRYVRFHGLRHPGTLGEEDVGRFLSHLAVEGRISASTQNQA